MAQRIIEINEEIIRKVAELKSQRDDLLEALELAEKWFSKDFSIENRTVPLKEIRAAISKANKGE